MKKIILLLTFVLTIATTAIGQVNPQYKGYVDFSGGILFPGGAADGETGESIGLSTSHGVQLFNSLFLGMGVDLTGSVYAREYRSGKYSYDTELEWGFLGSAFFDVRYNFLKDKKVTPFVGTRIGGGYQSYEEEPLVYFSPSAGVSFNFTQKFGLDVFLSYKLYSTSVESDEWNYETEKYYIDSYNYHGINLCVGIHF